MNCHFNKNLLENFGKIASQELLKEQQKSREQESWNNYYLENEQELITQVDEHFAQELEKFFLLKNTGKALDIGAGSGAESIWLARKGWDIVALDFASSAMTRLQKIADNKKLKITTLAADTDQLLEKIGEQKFDIVWTAYLHLPAEKRKRLFLQIEKCLKDKGIFFYLGLESIKDNPHLFANSQKILQDLPANFQVLYQRTKKGKVAINSKESMEANIVILFFQVKKDC